MNPRHVMVDIETLDTRSTAVVLSIGAVCFDPVARVVHNDFEININIEDCLYHGLTVSAATLRFWMGQGEEATDALFKNTTNLRDGMLAFTEWFRFNESIGTGSPDPVRVWAHGSTFDIPILANAYDRIATVQHLPNIMPWGYRMIRDTRTLFDLSPAALHHDVQEVLVMGHGPMFWVKREFSSAVKHRAKHDAYFQAGVVTKCLSWLRTHPQGDAYVRDGRGD